MRCQPAAMRAHECESLRYPFPRPRLEASSAGPEGPARFFKLRSRQLLDAGEVERCRSDTVDGEALELRNILFEVRITEDADSARIGFELLDDEIVVFARLDE